MWGSLERLALVVTGRGSFATTALADGTGASVGGSATMLSEGAGAGAEDLPQAASGSVKEARAKRRRSIGPDDTPGPLSSSSLDHEYFGRDVREEFQHAALRLAGA